VMASCDTQQLLDCRANAFEWESRHFRLAPTPLPLRLRRMIRAT
jgi:hypothetical protein